MNRIYLSISENEYDRQDFFYEGRFNLIFRGVHIKENTMIFIHHGRGVESGLADALEGFDLVHDPISDLKVDGVRKLIELFTQVYPHRNPCLVAGPLDEADPRALDILLKRIEEPTPNSPTLILWANDLGGVPPTIRSRCGEKFHYAPLMRHNLYDEAKALFDDLRADNYLGVMMTLREVQKGSERAFLEAYLEVLLEECELDLYTERLKMLLGRKTISQSLLNGYFLGEHIE